MDTGFNPENVLTAEVFPNWSKYTTPESRRQLFTDVLQRLQDRPGLTAAAVANGFPMASEVGQQRRFAIEGRTYEEPDLRPELETRVVSPDYFVTVGVPAARRPDLYPARRPGDDAGGGHQPVAG